MDKERFVELIEARGNSLYRVAWAILEHNADVADALQETALRAWQYRHQLREERFFGSWTTRICINVCRGMKRKRHPLLFLEDVQPPAVPPPDPALAMALHTLPEKLRLPLVLHCSEGMSYLEIARALGVPEPTVRGRIYRAREALKKELGECPVHDSDCPQSPNAACRDALHRDGPGKELDA